ncbi:MAG: ferredoxin [Boseongicola sp.]|nr:MAG: ferredoxin [Boseongicola sp.]
MSLGAVSQRLDRNFLDIFGAFHTTPEDGIGAGTLVLLGPKEPGFWANFTATPEWNDGIEDPMNRWSTRVISAAAADLGATALFPFGQPVRPFLSWALKSGRAWQSPVMLLVHDTAGMMVSYRGALLLPEEVALPETGQSPCLTCADQPCRTACPVQALTADGYDLDACHGYLDTSDGAHCLSNGCAVRRICPAGQSYERQPKQSAYHMGQFHK